MEEIVLVAYASTQGSTQEVAEFIAQVLREKGQVVDLQPARNVRSLQGCGAVVLGAPLYMFHWHKDALRFLARHQIALSGGLPIAVFGGGPYGTGAEEEWQEVRGELHRELSRFPWLKPVSIEVIGGRHDPARLHFPWNLVPALKQMPPSDLRDWEKIRAWAEGLVTQFSESSPRKQPALV